MQAEIQNSKIKAWMERLGAYTYIVRMISFSKYLFFEGKIIKVKESLLFFF